MDILEIYQLIFFTQNIDNVKINKIFEILKKLYKK